MASEPATTLEDDRREILRVHNLWADANRKGSIPMMRQAFVAGDKFMGFNLNGHTYGSIEEWAKLWEFYKGVFARATLGKDEKLHITVRGDVGWLTCENDFRVQLVDGTEPRGSGKFRSTEVYVREDETGRPVWKMWHGHFSSAAPAEEPRPAFGG
jgi:ketosteroid isomerase-like protein